MSKGIIDFLIKDLKNDFKLFCGIFTGKTKFNHERFKMFCRELRYNYVEIFKENYILYLLMLGSFLCGAFLASQYYEVKANEAIQAFTDSQTTMRLFINSTFQNESFI